MKISIITVVYNNKSYLEDAIISVNNQTYKNIEYIVIDGGSTDGTVEIIKKHSKLISKWISEPDSGIYDAMNKGIKMASGEIIGTLNSDDIYFNDDIIKKIADIFKDSDIEGCYGDILYVSKDLKRTIRYWSSGAYKEGRFRKGWMPPHPTFFARKKLFKEHGGFREKFKIVGDYELMFRFIGKFKIKLYYIPEVLVKMRVGGVSNNGLMNQFTKIKEIYQSWLINDINPPILLPFIKPLLKIGQYNILSKIFRNNKYG